MIGEHWKTHESTLDLFSCPQCGLETSQQAARDLAGWLRLAEKSGRKDVKVLREMASALCVAVNSALERDRK